MLYTNKFFIKTTEVKLRWRRTAEINAQVIKGEFISIISLLRIVGIRRSLVSSTVTHRQCLPNSSLNHCKGHFFDVSGKSLWDGCTSTSCKIMFHPQRRSTLKIMSLETKKESIKR